jgi:hypothetical protein
VSRAADDPARANFARNKTLMNPQLCQDILAGIDAVVSGRSQAASDNVWSRARSDSRAYM